MMRHKIWFVLLIVVLFAINFSGVSDAEITTTRDEKGVWFIKAGESDTLFDVFKAMGYATAKDRLWQMEIFRRSANGTLAAIFGQGYVEQDILVRVTGYSEAELTAGYDGLDQETQDIIDGYVEGINKRIQEISENPALIPFEFHAMGSKLGLEGPLPVDQWTPEDVLAWEAALLRQFDPGATAQGQLTNAALLGYLNQVFGQENSMAMFDDLRWLNDPKAQTYIPDSPVMSSTTRETAETGTRARTPEDDSESLFDHSLLKKAVDQITSRRQDRKDKLKAINAYVKMGSYAWVVEGGKTKSGNPILYSGPQMGFSVPAICQEGSIQAPGLKVSGMSIPGIPGIVIGRTPHHAWSMQVGHAHTTDYYMERPEDVQPARAETIEVAGGDSITVPVYKSGHGPVIQPMPYNPETYKEEDDGPIVTWRYSQRGHEFATVSAFLNLARAESMDEFGTALRDVAVSQHFCYADKNGNIAYWMSGMDPVRPDGYEYRLPQGFLQGSTHAEWDGDNLKPLSTDRNTVQGFYGGWNNKSSAEYPNSFNNYSYFFGPFHRAHVIEKYLETHDNLTFQEIRDLALNIAATDSIRNGGNPWEFVKDDFNRAVGNNSSEQRQVALDIMEGFDGHFVAGGKENRVSGTNRSDAWMLSDAWIREVIDLTFMDELGADQSGIYNSDAGTWQNPTILFNVILHALDDQSGVENHYDWFDNVDTTDTTETGDQIIVKALDNVLAELGERPWGVDKRGKIRFNHNLFNQDPLDLNPLHTIPFASRSTYAHCVEMGPYGPERIESMFALGQSGTILPDQNGNPQFDENFFSMAQVYDTFAHRNFPIFNLVDVKLGDVNHDGEVDLTDAVLSFQTTVGMELSKPVYPDADVNEDNVIGLEESIHAIQDHDSIGDSFSEYLQPFGPDSYFPVAEGAYWDYNNGDKVIIEDVDTNSKTFTVSNVNNDGYLSGYVEIEDDSSSYASFEGYSNPDFLPAANGLGVDPLMYETGTLNTGFSWQNSFTTNGKNVDVQCTVKDIDATVTLPNGLEYSDCLILERILNYPDGMDTSWWTVRAVYYLQKGVGYIYSMKENGQGNNTETYVTDTNLR